MNTLTPQLEMPVMGKNNISRTWNLFLAVGFVALVSPANADSLDAYPLAAVVGQVREKLAATSVKPTGLSREDYLAVVGGIVNFFKRFQESDGRIIDPFARKEVQYSTPCYAWAATALIVSGKQTNLLDSAASALDSALQQLAEAKAADQHGNFFTFPAMLAYEHLRDRVPKERRNRWEELLRAIDPYRAYKGYLNLHNWNVVALAGEFLRQQNNFTDPAFVNRYLKLQLPKFTSEGLYRDPNVPMVYDHFPRHFLAAILHRGYEGEYREELTELLERAAWTSLLMQSPIGELPAGGRSAQHQWNEAQQSVTYEIWATRKQREGDTVAAQAHKRAAHLALQSIRRWIRPSGELWIVKNRFDPAARHGYERYSFHSQYNLLAASMLASAWLFSDDAIAEGPSPAEVGGFVMQLPEFHKVIANASGLYLELDTAADPEYNSTGLIRVHRTGVEALVGPTDGSAIKDGPLAVGIAWREGEQWQSLAGLGQGEVREARLTVQDATPQSVRFSVRYELNRPTVKAVVEHYELTPTQVRVTTEVEGEVEQIQVRFPALAFDGQRASRILVDGARAIVQLGHSRQVFAVESPGAVKLRRASGWIPCRNGYLEAIEGKVTGKRVIYTLKAYNTI